MDENKDDGVASVANGCKINMAPADTILTGAFSKAKCKVKILDRR